jgi:hypothetical protein
VHDPGAKAASPKKLKWQAAKRTSERRVGASVCRLLVPTLREPARLWSSTGVMSRDVSHLGEASAGSDEASEGWQGADETVRDLARAMIPGTNAQCTSHTVDDLRLQPRYQAAPDVGRASDLAQPGGFRRVHVLESGAGAGAAAEYARQPLVTTLLKQGRTGSFVTDLVQLLEDGSAVRFESRPYRRGRKPVPVRTRDGPPPPPRPPLTPTLTLTLTLTPTPTLALTQAAATVLRLPAVVGAVLGGHELPRGERALHSGLG